MRNSLAIVLGLALVASLTTAALGQEPSTGACFFINQFQSWRAPDSETIFIRVAGERYFRLDMGGTCPELKWPDVHLVTKTRGANTVCSAVDWDLRVSTGLAGTSHPCIVKTVTVLSPAEVAAIPRKFKP